MHKFDLIVIGAGPAGTTAATIAAKAGRRVALVEKDKPGGTCLNYGCDPTKTLLHTANLLHHAKLAAHYGLEIPQINFNWQKVRQQVVNVQTKMRGGSAGEAFKKFKEQGIEAIKGQAKFISPHAIRVGDETFEGENFIIAVGNKPSVPPIEGLRQAGYITNIEAVSLENLPRRLAIVGGGAIGIEFAQIFERFGVEVTVLEGSPAILETEDQELATRLVELLQKEAITLKTGARLERVEVSKEGKQLQVRLANNHLKGIIVDEIMIAVGRRPALEGLYLEEAGVKYNDKGIEVDANLRTNVPHIWAAGDISGGYQFTHIAEAQGELAAYNVFSNKPKAFDEQAIGWVIFTDPELAHLGKTEEELKKSKVKYRALYQPLKDIARAIIKNETEGMVKLLINPQNQLLGAHILGAEAAEMLAPLLVIMQNGLPLSALESIKFPYPTLAQSLTETAKQAQVE